MEWLRRAFTVEGVRHLQYWQGEFLQFSDSHYSVISAADMRARAYRYLATCIDGKGFPIAARKTLVDNVLDGLRAAAKLLDTTALPAFLDDSRTPEDYIACKNGLLHIPTRKLYPATPVFFTRNALAFDHDPMANSPVSWLAFLSSIWGDDAKTVGTLQEFFGYVLTLDTRQQKILLLVGPKRSGKGTIARVLNKLVGAANACSPTFAALGTQFGLQTLIGKQIAILSDARVGPRTDSGAIAENLLRISGEDSVSVPRKFQTDYTAKLAVRFMVMSDELPAIADASGALASRFIILAMTRSFYGEEDHGLDDRLTTELPAILNWSLDGLERLTNRGHFLQPESAVAVQLFFCKLVEGRFIELRSWGGST